MKYCPKCKREYVNTLNFCTECGEPLIEKPAEVKPEPQEPVKEEPAKEEPKEEPKQEPKKKKHGSILKKILIGLLILVVAFFALGHYAMNAATYLRVEPDQIVAGKCGGQTTIDIDYDGYVWNINHKPEWVHIAENENNFEITLEKNETGETREGSVTIQSGKQLAQVTIVQNGVATYIKTSENNFSFGKKGGKVTVTVETDGCDWEAEYPKYLNVTKDDETTLNIHVPTNTSNYRTGYITIKEDNVSSSINFIQGGKCPNCDGAGESDCGGCFGSGSTGFGFYVSQCFICGGKGKISCSRCNGTGEIE